MKPPFRLAPSDFSLNTAEAAEQLLRQAKAGHAIGTAMIVMYEGGFYVPMFTGECHRSPVWTVGAVDILKAKLRRLAETGGD
ncbi:MAG TPA: hypothetical protein VES94_06205 [Burkholderiales bacterium]|nr:hypothetical protein [Burkholderiales bacterium]